MVHIWGCVKKGGRLDGIGWGKEKEMEGLAEGSKVK